MMLLSCQGARLASHAIAYPYAGIFVVACKGTMYDPGLPVSPVDPSLTLSIPCRLSILQDMPKP